MFLDHPTTHPFRPLSRLIHRLLLVALLVTLIGDLGCARLNPFTRRASAPPLELGMPSDRTGGYPGRPIANATTSSPAVASHTETRSTAPPALVAERVPQSTSPTRTLKAAEPIATAETVVAGGRERLEATTSYRLTMTRQERVGETLLSAENVVLNVRRNPRAVRLEWPDGPHKGREVIFDASQGGPPLMQIHLPDSLISRMRLAPDSPIARKTSRHPITEAGLDTVLATVEGWFAAKRVGDPGVGTLRFEPNASGPGLDQPSPAVTRIAPDGERRVVYFDPASRLPSLAMTHAPDGSLLESYRFLDFQADPADLASAEAFNPDARWGQSGGLFGRVARAQNGRSHDAAASPK